MKYISTRGEAPAQSFCDILLGGLAPDGGLYVPETVPEVRRQELAEWRELPYPALALRILQKFIDDIPACDLKSIVDRTYTAQTFRYCRVGRDASEITPLTPLSNGMALLELSNGPTLAFKDMAMQLLGNLFEYVLEKRGETINILGATSGDTGSAAEYALRGKKGVRVFMLSPQGRMSDFQRAQMYSLQDENIFNIAIEGTFDDCQDIVKAVSSDAEFKARHRIGAVNSINWARVMAQIVYYFKGFFAATPDDVYEVGFAVPSGNFGNICAGHYARMMLRGSGIASIERLVLATNENDVLDEFFRTNIGVYRPRTAAETHITSSPSMDIAKASNFERFIFDLVDRDARAVRMLWQQIATEGYFSLDGTPYRELVEVARYGIVSGRSTHQDRLATIREVWQRDGVLIDPHTADAVKVARSFFCHGAPMIVLETAQPVKFSDTIREALGRDPERPADFAGIENLPQRVVKMANDVAVVKNFIAERCA